MPRFLLPLLFALTIPLASGQCQAPRRYVIYLHGRIVEEGGRRPTSSTFGTYEYDAILDSLRRAGFTVLSDQRSPGIGADSFATHVVQQVDSLLRLGVPARTITVIGFSKGGAIAILASSRLQNRAISFVFMGACGSWAFERPDIRVTGRLLSLYETSDSLGISCAPLFARKGAGSQVREIPLSLGLGHGTFFQPRSAWLTPAIMWARGQTAPVSAPTPIDWSQEDSSRIAFLMAHGREYASLPVIVLAPVDSLDPVWLARFTDSLAGGVRGLKSLIGGPYRWQRIGSRPIRFYFSPDRFVSHADGRGGVFISLNRVRQRDAPFLHEAAHELLVPPPPFYPFEYPDSLAEERAAAGFPFWLSEGLPDYLAQTTATATGFPEGDVFAIGGLAKVDSVCVARLATSSRQAEIRARVGRPGRLEALFTSDRAEVAPAYYACSQSFTKHVVARLGLPAVVALFPRIPTGAWRDALEAAAGEPLERLRRAWLMALGLTPGRND